MNTRGADLSDPQLAERLANRDVDALAELYDRYGALAYSVALRVLGDSGRAEDVVQDAFLKIWNAAPRFDVERGALRAWLLTAVRNRSVDYLRGRSGMERRELPLLAEVPAPARGQDPWATVAASMERDAIRAGMQTLPGEQRQVVELAYFGGYTGREIAEMVRVPIGTVKGRMRLALEKLQSYLQGKGLEPNV
ncbi:MAG: sigma-70 family RNA polymerase sigma factor [Candidatus Dormiibacterota bacterium]